MKKFIDILEICKNNVSPEFYASIRNKEDNTALKMSERIDRLRDYDNPENIKFHVPGFELLSKAAYILVKSGYGSFGLHFYSRSGINVAAEGFKNEETLIGYSKFVIELYDEIEEHSQIVLGAMNFREETEAYLLDLYYVYKMVEYIRESIPVDRL